MEFSIVLPVFLLIVLGVFALQVLLFEVESVNNAVRAAARAGAVALPAQCAGSVPGTPGATQCPGLPVCEMPPPPPPAPARLSIAAQAEGAATTFVPVNPDQLCAPQAPSGGSNQELTQAPRDGKINLVLNALPTIYAPCQVAVTGTDDVHPLFPFAPTITLHSTAVANPDPGCQVSG